jgi:hypothetical protein
VEHCSLIHRKNTVKGLLLQLNYFKLNQMTKYREIPSLILMVLGLMAAWCALAVCQVGTGVQYFSAFVALGYWLLAYLSWPRKERLD